MPITSLIANSSGVVEPAPRGSRAGTTCLAERPCVRPAAAAELLRDVAVRHHRRRADEEAGADPVESRCPSISIRPTRAITSRIASRRSSRWLHRSEAGGSRPAGLRLPAALEQDDRLHPELLVGRHHLVRSFGDLVSPSMPCSRSDRALPAPRRPPDRRLHRGLGHHSVRSACRCSARPARLDRPHALDLVRHGRSSLAAVACLSHSLLPCVISSWTCGARWPRFARIAWICVPTSPRRVLPLELHRRDPARGGVESDDPPLVVEHRGARRPPPAVREVARSRPSPCPPGVAQRHAPGSPTDADDVDR